MRFSGSLLVLFLAAVPPHAAAALDFNSGSFGTVGISNTIFLFTPTGGTGPYVFSYSPTAAQIPNFRVINAPELPAYATATQTGGLAGLPQTTGLMSTTIRLTDTATNLFVEKAVSFTVSPVDLVGYGPYYYSIGDTVSQRFWPVGGTGPYSYTLSGTLPPGLSLGTEVVNGVTVALVSGQIGATANTATISGTTVTDNHYSFTITIHDSAGNTLGRGYSMAVSAMQLWAAGSPVNSGANRNLPNATVGLAYSQQISVLGGTGTAPYTFGLLALNALPSTLTLSSSGLISGTPTASNFSGRFTITVTDAAGHYMTARLAIKILPVTPVPLGLSTNTLSDSYIGSNFDWGIYATGGLPPYTFNVDPATPLPAGAVLIQGPERSPDNTDPDPAYLRQKVQTPGTYTFNLLVTDSAGNQASRAYSFKVAALSSYYVYGPGAVISTSVLGNAVLGVPYLQYLIPLGGTPPYTTTPIYVPAGLTIDNNDLLSGTPLEAGINLPLTYTLSDSASHQFNSPGNISIASSTSPGLTLSGGDFGVVQMGSQYTNNLTAGGSAQNPPVFTVSLVSGALPPGLSLLTGPNFNNGGNTTVAAQLAGIPNTPGVYTFVYRVVDGLGQVGEREVKLRVSGMAIVNTAFAPGTLGVPYTQTVDVRGGTAPYTFSLTTGSLPTGLLFNTTTGAITGTPLSTNSTSVTIQVQDQTGDILQRSFTLNIYPIQITGPDVLPNGTQGETYTYTFTPNPPGTYTFTGTGMPSGLTLSSTTGVLSGTLATSGTFAITITAYNSVTLAVVVRSFTMFVSTLSNLPLIGGLPTTEIDIGGVPTAYLGDFVAGTNLVTTLGVGSGGVQPYTISLVPPSTLPPGLALAIGSTYQGTTNFDRWTIAGVPATPGLYTFKLRYADTSGLMEDRVVAMNITTLGLATTNPSTATVNQPYSAQLYGTGGGGAYTFALVNASFLQANVMPPGLTLSPTGLISGTPTSTGVFSVNIQLTSGTATRRVGISITIDATADNRRIDFSLGPIVGASSTGRNTALGLSPTGGAGTHTWTLVSGTLPPGIQLSTEANLSSGATSLAPAALLAGAPTTAGTYNFRIRVDDSTGNFGIRDGTWLVSPMRLTPVNSPFFANTSFAPGQIGLPYVFSLSALNGQTPLTFTTDTGTLLPPGVTLSAAGLLSGTPTAAGNFVLYYHITDAGGNVRYLSTSISVYPGPIGINTQAGTGSLLPSGTVNTAYTLALNDLLSGGYGTPPFTWTVYDGTLPPGLSIVPGSGLVSATLSGTTTTAGTYTFSLLITDANAQHALIKSLQLTVSTGGLTPPPGPLPPAIAGVSYVTSLTPFGGVPPYNFATEYDSDMPVGLSLSPAGVISGTPSTVGPFVLYVLAGDSTGCCFRQRYTMNVLPVGTVIPAFTLTPASIDISYTIGDVAPAPIPISVGSVSTALAYTVSTGGTSWLSTTAASGTTPGAPSAIVSPGGLIAGNYSGAIAFTSPGASNSPASIPVNLSVVSAVVCTYQLSPTTATSLASGGAGSFNVIAPGSCAWAVDTTSLPSWVTITSATTGSGNGTVNYTVASNSAATPLTGNITVAGLPYTVTEFGTACSFTLQPGTVDLPSGAASGTISVNASATGCAWSTTQVDTWISLASGTGTGTGSGSVNLNFAANPNSSSRTGTMTIAGQTLTVNQTGVNCLFSLSSSSASFSSSGGTASFGVVAPTGCTWNADTGPSWISPTSPTAGSGNGTVSLSIAANSTVSARQANVLVGGQSFSVVQAGVPCSFSLSASNPMQAVAGGSGSVNLTTNPGCGWTASSNVPWLTPASSTGTGSGTLNFTVAANGTGAARSGVLTIVGQSITVSQSGPACAYSLQASSSTVPGAGGTGSVGVITVAGCGPWTAASNAPSWLHVTGAGSYTGPASATYSVDPNLTGADLFGTLTIAGLTFSVTEPALACPVTLGTASSSFGQFTGSGLFTFTTTPPGCSVTVQSYSSWLTITSQSPPGTISFSVAANTYAAARSGTIMVGNQTYTVNQAPSTCAYTLSSFAASFGYLGGSTGRVPVTFTPLACGAPPVLLNDPAGMLTLTASSPPVVGTYTQNYAVSIYQSFIAYVRTAQMAISGQIFTVKQTSW